MTNLVILLTGVLLLIVLYAIAESGGPGGPQT